MYIKSLTLRGFLCYKDATTIHFDPKFNVIVGPNGSGKSSLLSGMRFVMGDSTYSDKAHLLHQGTSLKVLVGYVSITLDNLDRRLPGFDVDEIVLRRDFGLKKDDFILNDKKITKSELQSLFESAGFSKTNPYYFVHQHEVSALSRMSNEERLKLLKEVAGTRVYDERRMEAAKSLEETTSRQRAIDSTLGVINKRMAELKEEQKELRELLECEKEKKCIDLIINAKELENFNKNLMFVNSNLEKLTTKLTHKIDELNGVTEDVQSLEIQWQSDDGKLQSLLQSNRMIQKKIAEMERDLVGLKLQQDSSKDEVIQRQRTREKKESELSKLRKELKLTETKMTKMRSIALKSQTKLREEEIVFLKKQKEFHQLMKRTNQIQQFLSVTERNKILSKEVKEKEAQLTSFKLLLSQFKTGLKSLEDERQDDASEHVKLLKEKIELEDDLERSRNEIMKLQNESPKLSDRRRILQSEYQKLKTGRHHYEDTLRYAMRRIQQTMRPPQLSANQAAQQWAYETRNKDVVYGTLLENLIVDSKYHVAVETAAAGQLFNFLVKDRHVAVEIIEFIKRRKEGSTTITPLRDVEDRETIPDYPKNDRRVIPLVDLIECHPKILPAVRQVLGRYLLVESRDVGNEYKRNGFDCITIDGDIVSRKGILSGGYRGRQQRLQLQKQIQETEKQLQEDEKRLEAIDHELADLDLEIMKMTQTLRHQEMKKEGLKLLKNEVIEKIRKMELNDTKFQTRCLRYKSQIEETEMQIQLLKEDIQRIRREIASPTLGDLNQIESKSLTELRTDTDNLEAAFNKKQKDFQKLNHELENLEVQLEEELKPQIQKLENEIADLLNENEDGSSHHELTIKITQIEKQLETLKTELKEIEIEQKEKSQSVEELNQSLQKKKIELDTVKQKIEYLTAEKVTLENQLKEIRQRRDEFAGRQQPSAGSSHLIEELTPLDHHALNKRLAIVVKKMRSFQNVNRKALDQFTSFVDEETVLMSQRDRLYKSQTSVMTLMKTLDDQKDSTLLRAFENVNLQFGEVFSEIVPGGKAKLILKKMSDHEAQQLKENGPTAALALIHDDQQMNELSTVDVFTGVGVKVQFPTFKGYASLESLSGGQKSVAALALVFALQRVDSAPFYVLDEVDANLDNQYRGAVANLIRKESQTNQIIVISHKAQTIQSADRFLRTTIVNQTTNIAQTTLEDALSISQRMEVKKTTQQTSDHPMHQKKRISVA